jgi:hypothetical protein
MNHQPNRHLRGVVGMLVVTLMWSIAGVVTRHLDSAQSFEVTFWRSFFTFAALAVYYAAVHGRETPRAAEGRRQAVVDLGPHVERDVHRLHGRHHAHHGGQRARDHEPRAAVHGLARALHAGASGEAAHVGRHRGGRRGHRLDVRGERRRGSEAGGGHARALAVPVAGAINWNVLQRSGAAVDLVPALVIGALVSSLAMLPLALPFQASWHDIGMLAAAGRVPAGRPVHAGGPPRRASCRRPSSRCSPCWRSSSALRGPGWAPNEEPAPQVLAGGTLVLATLAINEAVGMRVAARAARQPAPRVAGTLGGDAP